MGLAFCQRHAKSRDAQITLNKAQYNIGTGPSALNVCAKCDAKLNRSHIAIASTTTTTSGNVFQAPKTCPTHLH